MFIANKKVTWLFAALALSIQPAAARADAWPAARRMPSIVPGRSIGAVYLGESRRAVWRLAGRKPDESVILLDGRRREVWGSIYHERKEEDGTWLDAGTSITVIYEKSRVIQIRYFCDDDAYQPGTFLSLLAADRHLRKYCCIYDPLHPETIDPPYKYEYVQFYYDDLSRGIAYGTGVQDDFLLTYHPDAVIVHGRGVALDLQMPDATLHSAPRAEARVFRNEADDAKGIDYNGRP